MTWHAAVGHTTGHSTRRGSSIGTSGLVDSHHDRVELSLELLLLGLHGISVGVRLEELKALVTCLFNRFLVFLGEVLAKLLLLKSLLCTITVVFEFVLRLHLLPDNIILSLELVCVGHHLLDFVFRETTLVVSDGDFLGLTCGLIACRHIQDSICVNIEGDLDLGGATSCRWDPFKVELAKQVIVLGHLTLALVDLDEDAWLVVRISCESLLLLGGDTRVSSDEDSHDSASSLDTLGKRSDI